MSELGEKLQPPRPTPAANMSAIAEQIGHLHISKAVYRQQGNDAAADASLRAADAHLDLALTIIGLDPVADGG